MNNWAFLFLGLAIGWLIGMLVDWYYWRNRRICRDVEDKLRLSLQEVEGKNLSLQSQLGDYSMRGQKIGDLELALERRESELMLVTGDIDKRNKELQRLSADLNAKESRLLSLETELKQRETKSKTSVAVPTADFNVKENDLVERERRLAKLEMEIKGRENSFGDWEGRLKKRDAELVALAASLSGREKELSNVRLSAESQAETGKLEARIRELQQQLHSAESDRDRFERKVTDAEGFQRKLTQQVADCNKERTDLTARLEGSENNIKNLHEELASERDRLAQKLRNAEKEHLSLRSQLADLQLRATSGTVSLEKGTQLSAPEFNLPNIELPDVNASALSLGAAGLVAGLSGIESKSAEPASEPSFRPRPIDIEMPDVESELPKIDLPDVSVDVDDDLPTVDLPDVAITTGVAAMVGEPTESAEFLRLARSKAPTIDEISSGIPTGPATITGTGIAGTRIELLLERTSKGITTVGPDGRWSLSTFISEKGRFKLQARTIDSRNNLLSQSEKVRLRVFAPTTTPSNDDLKRIWGIGPVIEKLLQRNGINSFAKLSETPTENIEMVLREAGDRFNLANFEAWREQSSLAAAGKWQELKLLQEQLSAEREQQKDDENKKE